MFERAISPKEIRECVCQGEVIAAYPDEKPLPCMLILGFPRGRAVHVVIARNEGNNDGHVITAYVPDPETWDETFRERTGR
jgi:hypothetical protein